MPDSGTSPKDHFVKQRRNLVLMSLFIIFYHAANFKISEINILGNKSTIGNPEIVGVSLAIFFFYFCWRYSTALNSMNGFYEVIARVYVVIERTTKEAAEKYVCKMADVKKNDFALRFAPPRDSRGNLVGKYVFKIVSSKSRLNKAQQNSLGSIFFIEIKGWELLKIKCFSFLRSMLKDVEFGEYIFPIFLAFIAYMEICTVPVTETLLHILGISAHH